MFDAVHRGGDHGEARGSRVEQSCREAEFVTCEGVVAEQNNGKWIGEQGQGGQGPIARFLREDHRRLDMLLQSAVADRTAIDHVAYGRFRAGLLRHIGMEEKILLPAAQESRAGRPLPVAANLRLDHGAIASLLMPTPRDAIINMLREILENHNMIEEGPDGVYEMCERAAGGNVKQIMVRLQSAPVVNVMPYSDTVAVMNTVRRAVERAGYRFKE